MLDRLVTFLKAAGLDSASLDARALMCHVLSCDSVALICEPDVILSAWEHQTLLEFAERRAVGEPLAHILGEREFWSLSFEVTPETLVPRPDSETLVEAVIDYCRQSWGGRSLPLVDLGTGSGCLLIALLRELPGVHGVGVDRSLPALEVARRNSQRHHVFERAHFCVSDWLSALKGPFDLIVANPPYIPTTDITFLDPTVRDHDPSSALDGGTDGLDAYRSIVPDLANYLSEDGCAFLEVGINQMCAIEALLPALYLKKSAVYKDLAGKERVLRISRT
jgi:release factor glutamine methyltransferase